MNEQSYIDNIKNQIGSGMYAHLFRDDHVKQMVFLDIGANVGLVSIYAVPYCKRIVAIEPCPYTFYELTNNTKNYQTIECLNLALTPDDGEHEFFVNDINFTASSTVNTYGKRIMVEGMRLTSILSHYKIPHVDVCKIDAEGAEGESLNYETIRLCAPVIGTYYIETHNCPYSTWEHKLGTIVGNLARCGYSKMKIDGMAVTASK